MPGLKLGEQFYERQFANMPEMELINRFVELDPTNNIEGTSLLSRAGTNALAGLPAPIRAIWSQIGLFPSTNSPDGDLFIVAGPTLYRFDGVNLTTVTGTLAENSRVYFAPQWGNTNAANAGINTFQNLFISDESTLQYYGSTPATGTLTLSTTSGGTPGAAGSATLTVSGAIAAPDLVISIGGVYFQLAPPEAVYSEGGFLQNGPAGTPDGSAGSPFIAFLGATVEQSLANMAALINVSAQSIVTIPLYNTIMQYTYSSYVPPGAAYTPVYTATSTSSTLVITSNSASTASNAVAVTSSLSTATWSAGTLSGGAAGQNITNQIIGIGGTYYTWGSNVNVAGQAGTLANPWVALLGASDQQSLAEMVLLLTLSGTAGIDYSSDLTVSNPLVNAISDATTLTLTSYALSASANAITTTVSTNTYLSFGHATLTGGGVSALTLVPMPNGVAPKALAAVSSYVLVSVLDTQLFYYIEPGEQTIDPLNFNAKQSNPDNIVDMVTIGDYLMIVGQGSGEQWYPTGNADDAFAPYEGRAYMRGAIDRTSVLVKDSLILVGNDGVVYSIGIQFGTTAQWGVQRISTHGIEERIRVYLRQAQGLTP